MNRFTTYLERETGRTLMKTRRCQIVDGRLVGSQIDRYEPGFWRVWTNRVTFARKVARIHGLELREWDGEAEIKVPDALAVELLPKFGAKCKKQVSEATKARLRAQSQEALSLRKNVHKKALSEIKNVDLSMCPCKPSESASYQKQTNITHFPAQP